MKKSYITLLLAVAGILLVDEGTKKMPEYVFNILASFYPPVLTA